jgi:[acyl-carrier-protein] S-malonyltransferase
MATSSSEAKRPLVFLFPGQSSRDPHMFDRLAAIAPDRAARARQAVEDAIGARFTGAFASNREIQLAVFSASAAYLAILAERGIVAETSAGLSLGEYTHLLHIGALSEDDALALVAARGAAYDSGPDGVMLALTPCSAVEAEAFVAQVRREFGGDETLVALSNDNSPSQCVVAGERRAVERVAALAEQALAAVGHVIEDRVPMHTPRFAPAAAAFRPALERAPWRVPTRTYWPNVTGEPVAAPTASGFVSMLSHHVSAPVLWRQTVEGILARHATAVLVEVGPARVLTHLMGRRWLRGVRAYAVDLMDKAEPAAFDAQLDEIRHACA